jgi:F-type H+-transporting ATPase subunit b
MRIDWWTLALQAANFLVLVWLLQHFLYRPVQAIIGERQQQVASVLAEASAARAAAEQLRADLQEERAAIENERHQVMEEAHARAQEEAVSLLGRARADAEKLLAEERQRVAQERIEAADLLRLEATELGVAIGRRLLAEAGDARLDRTFLDRSLARLEALAEPERAALIDRIAHDDVVVQVVTAAPLDPADRDAFTERLRGLVGAGIDVQFADDPTLLVGAELHFPHTVLHHSWQDSLREIEEDLKRDGRPAGLA